jgi:hypothetical protein
MIRVNFTVEAPNLEEARVAALAKGKEVAGGKIIQILNLEGSEADGVFTWVCEAAVVDRQQLPPPQLSTPITSHQLSTPLEDQEQVSQRIDPMVEHILKYGTAQ